MLKKWLILILNGIILFLLIHLAYQNSLKFEDKISNLTGIITNKSNNTIMIKSDNSEYVFKNNKIDNKIGTTIELNCIGKLNKYKDKQDCEITDYKVIKKSLIPDTYLDNGLFQEYYYLAYQKLSELSLKEKIAQLIVTHYDKDYVNYQQDYNFGGFVFFAKDFKDKTKEDVIKMINDLKNVSNIPIITAVDEEGGKVSRISDNKNLVSTPFLSSQELYKLGGFPKIKEDVINKANILNELGLNVNLAPVVDVSENEDDYIYARTLGENTTKVAEYAKTVILASKDTAVTFTLKHFPGYGNNVNTHKSISYDYKSYDEILNNDLPPFIEGIKNGAEIIMNSHNIVTSIDDVNPASLSLNMHNLLRQDLNYTGLIITDDLNMKALDDIQNVEIKAILAGNDLLITEDGIKSFNNILDGYNNGLIKEEDLNHAVFRILSWKYYKGLLEE